MIINNLLLPYGTLNETFRLFCVFFGKNDYINPQRNMSLRRPEMNKEMMTLVIAQNGLKTAAAFFTSKGLKIEKQLKKESDKNEIARLKKSLGKAKKLSSILMAADEGITTYMQETVEEE